MSGEPPADAVVIALTGVEGAADQARVLAAIAGRDAAARVWVDWSRSLVAVRSALPASEICGALQRAGYGVLLPGRRRGGLGRAVGLALLFGLIGLVGGLVLGAGLGLANSILNPDCTRPGSSGNCAIGVGVFGFLGAVVGAPVGAVAGFIAGLAGRR